MCLNHSLADTAILDEVGFQTADLPVEQVVGLVDEAESDVRDDFCRTRFAKLLQSIRLPEIPDVACLA